MTYNRIYKTYIKC